MKKLYILILLAFLACISILKLHAQAPGGVNSQLSVWYKADNGISTNASKQVTQWNSSSSTNVSLTPNLTAVLRYNDQTTYTSTWNFNPTVTFDGSNNYLRNTTTAYLTSAGSIHYIVVAKGVNRSTATRSLFAVAGNDDGFFYSGSAGTTAIPTIGNNFNSSASAIPSPDDFGIYSAILPKTVAQGSQRGFYNGLRKIYTSPYPITGASYSLPTTGAYLGADGTTGDNFLGDIAEVIIYHSPVGDDILDSDLEKIHSYLAIKYGITLTSTQDYKSSSNQIVWNATNNADYNKNIFGIARDDASGLSQKQSISANNGQKLVIGNGIGLLSTNAGNTNNLSNGQFLITGDNGLKQSLTTPLNYTTGANGLANFRFEAIWKVQNTGSVGTVTVAWPKGTKNLYLVQSPDAAFDGTDSFTPMATEATVNGVVYNTANVTLANGQFFTFAGYEFAPGGVTSAAWYRADDFTNIFSDAGATAAVDNSTIQQWNEFNAKPFTLAQATVAYRPQFSSTSTLVNFNPTVNYDGTQKWMQYDPVANPQGYISDRTKGALFSAGYTTTATSSFFGFGASGAGNAMDDPGLYTFTGNKFLFYPIIGEYDPISTYPVNGAFIGGGTWENGAGTAGNNSVTITLDGHHQVFNANIQNVNTLAARGALMVGKADAGYQLEGQQNEMIVFANKLTDVEINKVESYLAIKYGKTLSKEQNRHYLSATGAVVWDGVVNNDYYTNVFGIGKEYISALNQKQATSINPNQKLVIGAGNSLFNTNAANTNALTEGQFLITGDNGLKQSLTTPLNYTTGANGLVNFRFESIWKVQNTGSVGTVTVAWPKGLKNLYLVQSPDAAFDGTDTFTPMVTETTVNGVVYNTANVTLTNGQFFTFAGYEFAPGGVTSAAWYRADDFTNIFSDAGATAAVDNSTIQQWNEFNAKPFTLAQSTVAYRPQFSSTSTLVNFNPTVNYDGTQKWMQYDPVANPQGYISDRTKGALFSAGYTTTATSSLFGFGASGAGNAMDDPGLYTFTGNKFLFYPIITEYDPISTYPVNGAFIGGGTWENGAGTAGSNSVTITLDGHHQVFNANIQNVNTLAARGALMVGKADVGYQLEGQQNEMIVFANKLTDVEINKVESYLAIKYGKTLSKEQNRNYLSATGAVVWDGTANNGYYNNVFGIANEYISALHQKQATSINGDQKLVIGAGNGLANTNAANSNTLADGQFLLTGDNGLKQGLATPLSYTTGPNGIVNFRFDAIWKVQNTGSVGTVTVAWPKGIKNLYLVQSPDAAFDGTDTFTPMATEATVNGVVYNTANVTLTNGQFFTFAGQGSAPGGVATNLSYWYRADKNATNTGAGTDVTAWTDMWSGTTAAQISTATLPKYAEGNANYFNFNPGVNFTAGTEKIGNISVQTFNALNYDVFTLTKEGMTSGGIRSRFFNVGRNNTTFGGDNWDSPGFLINGNIVRRTNTGADLTEYVVSPNFSTTIPSIAYHTFTDVNFSRGLNGAANGTSLTHTARGIMTGGHIFGDTRNPGTGGDDAGFIGNIGETIIYGNGNLTALERRKVDSYLAIKYGITLGQVSTSHYLDTDGNIVWNGASNTTFNNNIFGLSKDDVEVFEQKVSKSVNTGTILTIATINDFVNPNQAAARTGFTNDKTYLLLGDNNVAATTPLTSITVAGTTMNRIPRAWLSQRQNTPGVIYFEANLAGYGSTFASGNSVQMVVADDPTFTTNVKAVAGLYTAGKWVFNNSFDSDNTQRYITFATYVPSCTQPGDFSEAGLSSTTGVSNLAGFTGGTTGWPANVPNGHIVVESKNKGFVITRVSSSAAILNPVEGMLIYDIAAACMKLYNGTVWNSLTKDCL